MRHDVCTWQTKKVRERACGFCCALKPPKKAPKNTQTTQTEGMKHSAVSFARFIRKNSVENPRITLVVFEPDRNGISLRAHLVTAGVRYSHHCGLRFDRHRSFRLGKKLALKKVGLKSATKNVGETPAKLWSDVFSETAWCRDQRLTM